jgi:hypothetical protein
MIRIPPGIGSTVPLARMRRRAASSIAITPIFARSQHTTCSADEALWRQVISLRLAVRALFARAVAPVRPSAADADRLPPPADAIDLLNRASAAAPTAVRLDWPPDGEPRATRTG